MSDKPPEEYLLYVRIPDEVDGVRDDTVQFLQRVAKLLSDDDEHIYVEEYLTFDEEHPKMPRGKHDDDGQGYRELTRRQPQELAAAHVLLPQQVLARRWIADPRRGSHGRRGAASGSECATLPLGSLATPGETA